MLLIGKVSVGIKRIIRYYKKKMSTAKKWGVHLTWAKSMSWQHFCTHSTSECHCCAHSAGSLDYFLFYDLTLFCGIGWVFYKCIFKILRLKTERNAQLIHYQRCIHQYLQKEKKNNSQSWLTLSRLQ